MTATQLIDEKMIDLSIFYAHEYKRDGIKFLNTYKKFKSIRSVCESIVAAYKRCGAYQEMDQDKINFKPYAYKYFDGREAQIFADILLIIYNISR
jgi:hypothetical protein